MPSAHCVTHLFELCAASIPGQRHFSHPAPEVPTDAEALDTRGAIYE